MKLRIKGNSIRLRLTKTEVSQIKNGEPVTEAISFGGSSLLRYALSPSREVKSLQAAYHDNRLNVVVPYAMAIEWASGENVSIKNDSQEPFILVEKDFFCLKPRIHEVEDESDMFDNPNKAHGSCG